MHISPINKTREANTNFKKLKMNHYTHDYVKTISEKDRKLIQSWKKELANTKYFDILVSCDYNHKLTTFLYKKDSKDLIGIGPIEVINQEKNNLEVVIKVDKDSNLCNKYHYMMLQFPSKEKANQAKEKMSYWNNQYSTQFNVNQIGRAVSAVQVLEEAKRYENLSTWDKIKVKLGLKTI